MGSEEIVVVLINSKNYLKSLRAGIQAVTYFIQRGCCSLTRMDRHRFSD